MTKLTRALEAVFFDMVFAVYALFAAPLFIAKGKLREGWGERWGRLPAPLRERLRGKDVLWIHAVSVGEARLACHLVRALRRRLPGTEFVLSTTTSSGRRVARENLAPEDALVYFPFDFSFAVGRFLNAVRPRLVVIFETEIWPNLLGELRARGVPVVVANGRISDAAFRRYRRIAWVLRRGFRGLSLVLAQSTAHRDRFVGLGVAPARARVVGNMKFDLQTPAAGGRPDLDRVLRRLKSEPGTAVLLASSTHAGEEEVLLAVYLKLKGLFPDLRLLVAPRHIERLASIEALIARKGLSSVRLSALLERGVQSMSEILLVDVWGILHEVYPYADAVFVGGSFVPTGGHNIAEPASSMRCVLHGPFMANFTDMVEEFRKDGAAVEVRDGAELEARLVALLRDPGERERLGQAARDTVLRNAGSTERVAEAIVQGMAGRAVPGAELGSRGNVG